KVSMKNGLFIVTRLIFLFTGLLCSTYNVSAVVFPFMNTHNNIQLAASAAPATVIPSQTTTASNYTPPEDLTFEEREDELKKADELQNAATSIPSADIITDISDFDFDNLTNVASPTETQP